MMSVGKSPPRHDCFDKVMGKARYAGDLTLPGMLHMQLVYSERVHAVIRNIEEGEALRSPGVVRVLTARDVPVNCYGLIVADRPVFCGDKVRHASDHVAAVLAETREQATTAAGLVKVTYDDLPLLCDPLQALAPGAVLIHSDKPGNIASAYTMRVGDVEKALAEADVVISCEYCTPMQEQSFLEPEAGLAYIDDEDRLTIITAGQSIHDDRMQIAAALNLPEERVRVIYGPIGGSFGGREDLTMQVALALGAWITRRPVKLVWNREESIRGHGKRHAMVLRYTWGAKADGKITAAKMEIISDAGAYCLSSSSVLSNFRFAATGAYQIPNIDLTAKAIYTNNIPGGAFRGFGIPQVTFACEMQVNQLAEALGIDPVTIRLRNCLRDDGHFATGSPVVGGTNLPTLIETCAMNIGATHANGKWSFPDVAANGNKYRGFGIGVAVKNAGFSFGFQEGAAARVILHGNSEIEQAELHTAAADVGQGSHAVLRQICAETLHLPLEKINIKTSDTALVGDAGPASASRLTFFAGNGVRAAATQALQAWAEENRPAVGDARYNAPQTTPPDPLTGACLNSVTFMYAAHAVELEVDIETGEVEILRIVAAHDPGQAINPQQVAGQIEGALLQALGWTLMEDFKTRDGIILTDKLSTYLVPTVRDLPQRVNIIYANKPDPEGPFGARGIGEIPFIPLPPAIAAAIRQATGIWFESLPVTPEKIVTALASRLD